LKNDPDKYDKTLCLPADVGCEKWTANGTELYFKNPGNAVCEWRQSVGTGENGGWGWYKKKLKRCNGTGAICAAASQCSSGQACSLEAADNPCPTDQFKTFGQGGLGNEVYQPAVNGDTSWVGACDAAAAGCTEYIDPISDFSEELIYNSDLTLNRDSDTVADGWNIDKYQEFTLEGNNLYILTVESSDPNFYARINLTNSKNWLYELSSLTNKLSSSGSNSLNVPSNESKLFYLSQTIRFDSKDLFQVLNIEPKAAFDTKISLKKALINYQVADKVDKTFCSQANLANGCVYLNERAIKSSSGLSLLDTNAFAKYNPASLISVNNSNALVKVRPDRDCGSWLSCKSYIKDEEGDNVCFEVASCDRLNPSGECANFTVKTEADKANRTYATAATPGKETAETIKNLSGYSKVGYEDFFPTFKALPNNLYSFGDMKQVGSNVSVANGDFELYGESDYKDKGTAALRVGHPTGWNLAGRGAWTKSNAETSFSVIADPVTAEESGVAYPMIGKSFLRYSLGDETKFPLSEIIYVDPNAEYYLSYYINTSQLSSNGVALAQVTIKDGTNDLLKINQEKNSGWVFHAEKFYAPGGGSIRLELGGVNATSSKVYIDDIKISPVLLLAGKKVVGGNFIDKAVYAGQSCRLYPAEDALSCEYFDDTGSVHRGESGYCLEYDRYPGDPNTCLLWWPIDKIQGSGFTSRVNSAGYSGRAPLYYCMGANTDFFTSGNGERINYPYILRTEFEYLEEESLEVYVNENKVLDVGNHRSGGSLNGIVGDYIPLEYGTNTIKVIFEATESTGQTFMRLDGSYHFLGKEGEPTVGMIDFVDLYRDVQGESTSVLNNLGYHVSEVYPDGSVFGVVFECGNSANDNKIGVDYANTTSDCPDDGRLYIINRETSGAGDKCENGRLCDGGDNRITMSYTFYIPDLSCTKIAQVVTPSGENKAWASRVKATTGFTAKCNQQMPISSAYGTYVKKADELNSDPFACASSDTFLADKYYTLPFGSITIPEQENGVTDSFKADPIQWSSAMGELTTSPMPLPYASTTNGTTATAPYPTGGGHMGQLYDVNSLSYLFFQSYGTWKWDENLKTYLADDSLNWNSPAAWCPGNVRANGQGCAVAPDVFSIKGNNMLNPIIYRRGFLNLTFNSRIDSEQLPLTAYEIDWGDGEKLVVSGLQDGDRPDEKNPHSAFHSYEYWDLKTKDGNVALNSEMPTLNCPEDTDYCIVKPRIKIRDNWGWCTEGHSGAGNTCPSSGVCMNSSRAVNTSDTCHSNYNSSYNYYDECGPAFPICSDGFYEFPGVITVYEK
jgi:hypothetical protein